MKIAIDQVVGTVSPRPTSHKGGWAYLWANQLKHYFRALGEEADIKVLHNEESWDGYDLIFLDHGMEFNGESLNLFGGAQDAPASRLARLIEPDPDLMRLVSLDRPMPDYGALGKGRLKSCSDGWRAVDWDLITERSKSTDFITQQSMGKLAGWNHLALGDSHTFSMYKPGMMVCRNDGQTLHGALKRGLKSFIEPFSDVKHLTLYFGNIDIRHHLMRQGDPFGAMDTMLDEYFKQIKELGMESVELIETLPIENESRKLPKTGFYKGKPFAGTWAERTKLHKMWNIRLDQFARRNPDLNVTVYKHPDLYKNELGELRFSVMEKPQSVHLARLYYRWDLERDCLNEFEWIDESERPKNVNPPKVLIPRIKNVDPVPLLDQLNGKQLIEF